jgi:polysaccharide pyruvyl transferase WcaK-like protein
MKVLVDHGAYGNLGDTSMIEAVVLRLQHLLPEDEIYVIDRPSLKTKVWDLPNVFRQEDYSVKVVLEDTLARAPFLWRYSGDWRKLTSKVELLFTGSSFAAGSFSLCNSRNTEIRFPNLGKFCEQFDALHIVGGGNLNDIFYDELFRKCLLIQAFAEQDKPIILTGQQLGPFSSAVLKKALAKTLQKANFVGLREPGDSLAFCQEACIETNCFDVMGDDSFGLSPVDDNDVLAILAQYGVKENGFLAFNIRIGHYAKEHAKYLQQISIIVDKLSKQFQMPVLIVPVALSQNDNDITSGKKLVEMLSSSQVLVLQNNNLTSSLVKGVLGKAFGAVGVSYHFCTFALSQGVPSVCIYDGEYYSQKARGLCDFWGDKRLALPLKDIITDLAVYHLVQVFKDDHLRRKLKYFSKQAIEHWKNVFDTQVEKYIGNGKG